MTFLKTAVALLVLLLAGTSSFVAAEPGPTATSVRIATFDPPSDATLGIGDRLYLRIHYESPVPVRFLPEGYRHGQLQEHDAASSAPPHDAGRGEALVWILYNSPARIDEIRIVAYDLAWQPLATAAAPIVLAWEYLENYDPRTPANWVEPMIKHHRRVFDTAYDPQPDKPEPLFDLFVMISFLAIPGYLLMQAQMLARYRGKWQWYAFVPLLPLIPMGIYSLFGLGLSKVQWIKFLFHYMAVALLYLLILWAVKWDRERALRKWPHQVLDGSSGME